MLSPRQNDWFERDFVRAFDKVLTGLIPTAVAAALIYGSVMLLTQHALLGVMGVLSLLLAPVCWYAKRMLNQGRAPLGLAVFTIATLLILSAALLIVEGFDTVIVAGFSVPILAAALLHNIRFTIGITIMATLAYCGASLLRPLLPWQPIVLTPSIREPLSFLLMISIFGALGLLSWQLVGLLQRALTRANQHIEALDQANAEQQRVYAALAAQHAEQQRLLDVITALETPIIPLQQHVLLVPLVGSLDTQRAQAARSRILTALAERRAQVVILDITSVAMIDTAVARQLLMIAQSVRLMGAEALFTGMKGEMAQMLVQMGIDLRQFRSIGTLEDGIESVIS